MLLKGLNHVGVITNDATRLNDFYKEVFDAEILRDGSEFPEGEGPRLSIDLKIGAAELYVFRSTCNTSRPADPGLWPGAADHLALQASSVDAFEQIRDRLMARGAADDFVTDFGPMLSIFFRDPDGLRPRSASRIRRAPSACTIRPGRGPPATPERSAGSPAERGIRDGGRYPPDVGLVEVGAGRHDLVDAVQHVGARGAARARAAATRGAPSCAVR